MNNYSLAYVGIPLAAQELLADRSDTVIATSVMMCLHCARALNGGRIEACRDWTADQWARRCIPIPPLDDEPGLWHWEGDDLVCDLYPASLEAKALALRAKRTAAARKRWKKGSDSESITCEEQGDSEQIADDANAHANAYANAHANAYANAHANAYANAMQMHMQDKKRKEKIREDSLSPKPSLSLEPPLPALEEALPEPPEPEPSQVAPSEACPAPAGERERYADWLSSMLACHPSSSLMGSDAPVPRDVDQSAQECYQRMPGALEHASLLRAYMASRMDRDRRGQTFFRPRKLSLFFSSLDVVILDAQRWARETSWKAREGTQKSVSHQFRATTPGTTQNAATGQSDAILASREECAAFWRELNNDMKSIANTENK